MKIEKLKNADEFFEHQTRWYGIESQMEDIVMGWFGIDPYGDDIFESEDEVWFFEGIRFDYYDYSFELTQVENDWEPTEEQIQHAVDFGMMRCWFNYKDGSERYCYVDKNGEVQIGEKVQK